MVSIAMATYNGAEFLSEQIDSILRQTVTDWELVISDDCSTDETKNILESYAKKDHRIKIIFQKRNKGFLLNFQCALKECQGDYVALSDQDDIWTNNHLEVLLSIINGKQLACGNSLLVDRNNNSLGITLKEQEVFDYIPSNPLDIARTILIFRNPFQGAAMLLKKEFLNIALPIPESAKYHDVWFACFASFLDGISYTEKVINRYRIHGNNVSGCHEVKNRDEYFAERLRGRLIKSRYNIIKSLEGLNLITNKEKRKVVKEFLALKERAKSRGGRLQNLIYLVRHYTVIFSSKKTKNLYHSLKYTQMSRA